MDLTCSAGKLRPSFAGDGRAGGRCRTPAGVCQRSRRGEEGERRERRRCLFFFFFFFDDDDYGDKGCLLFSKGSVGGFVLFQGRMGFLSIKNNFRGFVFFQGSLGFSSIKNNLFRVLL